MTDTDPAPLFIRFWNRVQEKKTPLKFYTISNIKYLQKSLVWKGVFSTDRRLPHSTLSQVIVFSDYGQWCKMISRVRLKVRRCHNLAKNVFLVDLNFYQFNQCFCGLVTIKYEIMISQTHDTFKNYFPPLYLLRFPAGAGVKKTKTQKYVCGKTFP